jgi:hypothetical protein
MKGGGQPSAALSVGSRAVGKRKTLCAMRSFSRGHLNRSQRTHDISWGRDPSSYVARDQPFRAASHESRNIERYAALAQEYHGSTARDR